ncbi:MAG: hypothetical protein F6K40_39640, partial [Okeania sp. SIO3I5]|uniref:WD40 repeat domain-containing protein n=1 Tax=Okeania sp. SIO3I5 TaxID=2607805 RepID=UPI0013B603AC
CQGKLLQTLSGHESWVNGVAFSPNSQMIAFVSDDKTVKLWNGWKLTPYQWACNWVRDYLENNPTLSESDRHLCDGVGSH